MEWKSRIFLTSDSHKWPLLILGHIVFEGKTKMASTCAAIIMVMETIIMRIIIAVVTMVKTLCHFDGSTPTHRENHARELCIWLKSNSSSDHTQPTIRIRWVKEHSIWRWYDGIRRQSTDCGAFTTWKRNQTLQIPVCWSSDWRGGGTEIQCQIRVRWCCCVPAGNFSLATCAPDRGNKDMDQSASRARDKKTAQDFRTFWKRGWTLEQHRDQIIIRQIFSDHSTENNRLVDPSVHLSAKIRPS